MWRKYPSQTKAAGSLKNTSVGTVSNILNGRYENISDEMFRNIASQVGGVNRYRLADCGDRCLSGDHRCTLPMRSAGAMSPG